MHSTLAHGLRLSLKATGSTKLELLARRAAAAAAPPLAPLVEQPERPHAHAGSILDWPLQQHLLMLLADRLSLGSLEVGDGHSCTSHPPASLQSSHWQTHLPGSPQVQLVDGLSCVVRSFRSSEKVFCS